MGKMICTKEAREACGLAYMCEENAEVMDDSECADLIVKMEAAKWDNGLDREHAMEEIITAIHKADGYIHEDIADEVESFNEGYWEKYRDA